MRKYAETRLVNRNIDFFNLFRKTGLQIGNMEDFIIAFLKKEEYTYSYDLHETDLHTVYDLYKNNSLDETITYNAVVSNYLGIYYAIKYYKLSDETYFVTAKKFYKKSIEGENDEAMYNLGYTYTICKRKHEKAKELFYEAIERGNCNAMKMLGCMYYCGEGFPVNHAKAKQLYEQAINVGQHPGAMYQLGYIYMCGQGVEIDKNKAKDLFQRAINAGHMSAYYSYFDLCEGDYDKLAKIAYSLYLQHDSTYLLNKLYHRRTYLIAKVEQEIQLKEEVKTLKATVEVLQKEVEDLHNKVDYQPDGKGYEQAKEDFNSLLVQQQETKI